MSASPENVYEFDSKPRIGKSRTNPTNTPVEAMQKIIRMFVGRGLDLTVEDLAGALGCSENWVYSVKNGAASFTFADAMKVAAMCGPHAVNIMMGSIGYRAIPLDDREKVEPWPAMVALSKATSSLAEALADSRLTADETKRLTKDLREAEEEARKLRQSFSPDP